MAVGRLRSIAGPLIAGELRNGGFSPGEVFLTMTPAALVAAVIVFALVRTARPVD